MRRPLPLSSSRLGLGTAVVRPSDRSARRVGRAPLLVGQASLRSWFWDGTRRPRRQGSGVAGEGGVIRGPVQGPTHGHKY